VFLAIGITSSAFAGGSASGCQVPCNLLGRATAHVVDKKENQFWVCSARYNYRDLTANDSSCVKLAAIGRHSLNEIYVAHAVTGSETINPFLPVIWFIDRANGDA
jgi:hypothetical protein